MKRIQLVILWLIAAFSNAAASPANGTSSQVEACLSQLLQSESSYIVNGSLSDQWSAAWTIWYSDSRITFVSIRHSLPEDVPESGHPSHDWAILCTVDESGSVISLESPEKNDLVKFIEDDESLEDREYELLVERLSTGKSVYRYDTYFRLNGDSVVQLGETRQSAVDPSDFGIK